MLMIKVIEISRKWFVVLSLLKYKARHLQRLERYSLDWVTYSSLIVVQSFFIASIVVL